MITKNKCSSSSSIKVQGCSNNIFILNNNNKKKQRWVKNLDIANFLFHVKVNIHRTVTVRNLRHCHNITVSCF